jgi:cell division septum initiation protein DivIVA
MVAATRTRTTCGIVAAVLAGSLWLLPAVSAQSSEPPPPGLEKLWEEYPLAPETQPRVRPEPVETPAVTPTPQPTDSEAAPIAWLALAAVGIGGAIVLLVAGGSLARRRRTAETVSVHPDTPDVLIARARALAMEVAECDKYLHGQRDEGNWVMTGTADHGVSDAPYVASQPTTSTFADIGERVAGVLAAAEAAANQIREDARGSADEILSIAREEAEALRRDASAYDTDTRAAVESYASDRRREVDEDVQQLLADAESQARATRQAAEAMARRIEEDAKRRGQALREESRAVEERLTKAAQGLRRMTAEIDELLGAPDGTGESLTDALRPYSQHQETPAAPTPNDGR